MHNDKDQYQMIWELHYYKNLDISYHINHWRSQVFTDFSCFQLVDEVGSLDIIV